MVNWRCQTPVEAPTPAVAPIATKAMEVEVAMTTTAAKVRLTCVLSTRKARSNNEQIPEEGKHPDDINNTGPVPADFPRNDSETEDKDDPVLSALVQEKKALAVNTTHRYALRVRNQTPGSSRNPGSHGGGRGSRGGGRGSRGGGRGSRGGGQISRGGGQRSRGGRGRGNKVKGREKRKEPPKPAATRPSPSKKASEGKDILSPPESSLQVKNESRTRKFEVVARQTRKLQIHTTWEDEIDQKEKPKHQHVLFTYDEMVKEPHLAKKERYRRVESGQFYFLVPSNFDPRFIGKKLEAVGREMKEGKYSRENWKIVDSILDYHKCLFGSKVFKANGDNNQAKNNPKLGPGYDGTTNPSNLP